MSLDFCDQCGGAMSRAARNCPHCGEPRYMARLRKELVFSGVKLLGMASVLVWVGWQIGWVQLG